MGKLLVILGAIVLLVGCGARPSAPAPETPTAPPRNITVELAERTHLAALLHQIDPGLVAHLDRAIDNGGHMCEDLAEGEDHATVVKNAASPGMPARTGT